MEHDYTGDPKHCHQCALFAWRKEWHRADKLEARLNQVMDAMNSHDIPPIIEEPEEKG
jgi:hypothetical protein